MLHSQVVNFDFFKPIEGKIGKLVGMMLNTDTWRVTHFVISHGMGKSTKMTIEEKHIKKFDMANNLIYLTDEHEEEPVPTISKRTKFMCKDFIGLTVLSADGKKVGKISDFDIPEKLKIWKVWKVMIKTSGFKNRRLRISPDDIRSIGQEMTLRKDYEELFPSREE